MTLNSKRRRLYLHDPSIPIPRTTLWYQSKYHSSLPVCQNFSDRDEQEPPSDPESPSNQDVQEPPCDQDSQDPPSEWDDQQRLSNLGDQEPPSYQDSQDPSSDRDDREQLSDQSSQDPPSDWDDQEPPSDSGDQDPPSDWDDQEPPSDSGDQDPPSDWDDPDPSSDQELDMNHHPTGNRSSDHEDPNSSDPPTDDPDSEANREPLGERINKKEHNEYGMFITLLPIPFPNWLYNIQLNVIASLHFHTLSLQVSRWILHTMVLPSVQLLAGSQYGTLQCQII